VRGREIHADRGADQAGLLHAAYCQEHSYVKDMWLRLTNPDVLVFLDASYTSTPSAAGWIGARRTGRSSSIVFGMPAKTRIYM